MLSWLGNIWFGFLRWITGAGLETGDRNPDHEALWQQLLVIEGFAIRFFILICGFALIFSVGQVTALTDWNDWRQALKIFGILLGVIAACAISGGLLGFIFGIPRQGLRSGSASDGPATPTAKTSTGKTVRRSGSFFEGNTNLEEVSDWITKIIVGLSLVQAKNIYDGLAGAAAAFKAQALPDTQGADVVFVILTIAAVCGGFLFFYLETRTRIPLLFSDASVAVDNRMAGVNQASVLSAVLNAPILQPDDLPLTDRQAQRPGQIAGAAPISEDDLVIHAPYDALKTSQQIAAWASAQARSGNYEAAARALEDAIKKNPGDKNLLIRLVEVRQRQGDPRTALALLSEVQDKTKEDDPELLKRELYTSLYLPPPEDFEKALPIAEKLLAIPEAEKDPYVHVWTAAAHAHRYAWLTGPHGDEAKKAEARAQALKEVKRAIELTSNKPSHSARALLRQFLDPGRENSLSWDNDLEVFKNDAEFRNLIYPEG